MKKLTLKLILLIIFTAILLTGCGSAPSPGKTQDAIPSTLTILDNLQAQQELMLTFAKAYPDKIGAVEFLNGDWTMQVNGRRFYFAKGRFLPEEMRDKWEDYLPYDFYAYPWTGTAEDRRFAFDNPVYSVGSSFLYDTLYASSSEEASWEFQVKYNFFGVKMLINSQIRHLLDRIVERISIASRTDPSINEWIAELQTNPPTGWNWRIIANTNRRSNHSYGIAIDLLPKNLKGRYTYWVWEASETVDRETYYMPPDSVIKIFENFGFVWGGGWALIDTMHFEYRPEILILSGLTIER